jgi:hypothetical protein
MKMGNFPELPESQQVFRIMARFFDRTLAK